MKRMITIVILLFLFGSIGCNSNTTKTDDYLLCSVTSRGTMAETKDGFFMVKDQLLYYADKTDLTNWVVVCNKPNCTHDYENVAMQDVSCNGWLLSTNHIMQNGDHLYGLANMGFYEGTFVFEIQPDGSGIEKVYELKEDDGIVGAGMQHVFAKQLVTSFDFLDEFGTRQNRVYAFRTDENGNFATHTLYESNNKGEEGSALFFMKANDAFGIRGDDVVLSNLKKDELWGLYRIGETELEKITLPEDVEISLMEETKLIGSYISGDTFIYYGKDEGFYEVELSSGEKKVLFENQIANGFATIFAKDCMIEYTRPEHRQDKDSSIRYYDGNKWFTLEYPEAVQNTNDIFVPIALASDRMFWRHTTKKGVVVKSVDEGTGEVVESVETVTAYEWYYMMLDSNKPTFVSIGEIEKEQREYVDVPEEESNPEINETDKEETIVFQGEEGLVKVVGTSQGQDDYEVALFWELGTSTRDYLIYVDATINGIYCGTVKFLYSWSYENMVDQDTKITNVSFTNDAYGVLKKCGISDCYSVTEFTDIALDFYFGDWNTGEVFAQKSVHIYPNGEENLVYFEREQQPTDLVLVEEESISITFLGYEENVLANDTLQLFVENKTEHDFYIDISTLSINGLRIPSENIGIQLGAIKGNTCGFDTISLYDTSILNEHGITEIKTIQLLLECAPYDLGKKTATGESFLKKVITLYPQGEENAEEYVRQPEITDVVLVDNEFLTLTLTGYEDAHYPWKDNFTITNGLMNVVLKNKTDDVIGFCIQVPTVNGFMGYESEFITYLLPQDTYIFDASCNDIDKFQQYGITNASRIEFLATTYDANGTQMYIEPITLYPNGEAAVSLYEADLTKVEEVLIDNEFLTVAFVSYQDAYNDKIKNGEVILYVHNKTNKTICYEIQDAVINGIVSEDETWQNRRTILLPNGHKVHAMYAYLVLKSEQMTALENMMFTFTANEYHYNEGQIGEELVSKPISLQSNK